MTFSMLKMAKDTQLASQQIATLPTQTKNDVLQAIANNLRKDTPNIIEANSVDIINAKQSGLSAAMTVWLLGSVI